MGVDLQTKRVPIALYGINKVLDPARMDGKYTPYMKNMEIYKGRLRKYRGYTNLGTNYNLEPINRSTVGRHVVDYVDARGDSHFLAFTSTEAFHLGGSGLDSQWYCVNPGVSVDTCASGWTDAHADLTVDHFGINLRIRRIGTTINDSNKITYHNFSSLDLTGYTHISGWIYRDAGAALEDDLTIVISEAADGAKSGDYVEVSVGDPGVLDQYRFFSVAVDLSSMNAAVSIGIWNNSNIDWDDGDSILFIDIQANTIMENDVSAESGKVKTAIATDTSEFSNNGGRALIITNDDDDLFYFEGHSGDRLKTLVHTFPSFANCRDVVEFWNHLMLVHYDNGNANAMSIAHSAAGDVDDHASSSSGIYTLFDTIGEIKRAIKVGGSLVIFSRGSITIGDWFGDITKFTFNTVNTQLGLISDEAVCVVGNVLFFVGSDRRFYYMTVGSTPVEIGANIVGQLNYVLPSMSRVFYNNTSRKIMFQVDDKDYYVYNLNNRELPFEYLELTDDIRSVAMHSGAIPGHSTLSAGASAGISVECEVFVFNEPSLGGDGIACEYQTEDITLNDEYEYCRWQEFTFTAKSPMAGATLTVEYSTDGGTTWESVHPPTIYLDNNKWKTYIVTFDVVSRKIRMRFTQTDKSLEIKDDMFIGFLPELVYEDEVE